MTGADGLDVPSLSTAGGAFAESCAWVVDAHASSDPQQLKVALTQIYRLLVSHGWQPSRRAAALLRVHDAALDVELSVVVSRRTPGRDDALS